MQMEALAVEEQCKNVNLVACPTQCLEPALLINAVLGNMNNLIWLTRAGLPWAQTVGCPPPRTSPHQGAGFAPGTAEASELGTPPCKDISLKGKELECEY